MAVLAALAALLALLLSPALARADVPGALSGHVDGPVGPLEGVQVSVEPVGGGPIQGTTETGIDGNYTLAPLDAGSYIVHFEEPGYVAEYYDNAPDAASADTVVVEPFTTTENIDATLIANATISGTVRDSGLNPVAGICVSADPVGGGVPPQPVITEPDGEYQLIGIEAGTYTVQFDSCDSPNNLVTEWYDDQPSPATADELTLTTGETMTGVDAVLATGGSISGTVLRANGLPADGAEVRVTTPSGTLVEGRFADENGDYTVDQLGTGSYRVEFLPPAGSEDVSEWYDDAADVASATPVGVTIGANTPGIDAQLSGDAVPPALTIDSGPSDPTNNPRPVFDFSTEPGATVECAIDPRPVGTPSWGSCSDPASHTPASDLPDDDYTFSVRATDPSLNSSSATWDFTVDTQPPTLDITGGPSGTTGFDSATFEFDAEAGAILDCAVDPAGTPSPTYGACTGPTSHDTGTLADGDWVFQIRATDAAGNFSTDQRSFTVDTDGPDVQVVSGPTMTSDTTPTYGFTLSQSATVECAVDPAPASIPSFGPCSDTLSHTPAALTDGQYVFTVRASDDAGNTDTDTRGFTVDTVAPAVQVTGGPTGTTTETQPTFTFTSEAGATVACSIDTGTPAFGPCSGSGSHSPSSPLAGGSYTFRVRATDAAGNSASDTRSFTVDAPAPPPPPPPPPPTPDTTPPVVTITGGPKGKTKDTTPKFSFTSSESGSSFRCKVDNGAYAPCNSPTTLKKLKKGKHTFSVTATDAAGNTSAPATRSFKVKKKKKKRK
jgi:hypothetical protein